VAGEPLTLEQILQQLDEHNPTLAGAAAQREAAFSALETARAYPNPELELNGGTSTGIGEGALNGDTEQIYLSQPLDLPFMREARREVAEAGIVSAESAQRWTQIALRAQVKQAFYEILRRQAELDIARDNEQLLEQIRDKVKIKVEVGEAPRYEAVKAEAEWLNAVKIRESASVRVEDAKSALRALLGAVLPRDYEITGELPAFNNAVLPVEQLRETLLGQQPALQAVRAQVEKAMALLHVEEKQRYPQPTLKVGAERDPGLESWRVGISLPLPLWNQRQGPIGEARAALRQAEAQAQQQELALLRELESAYNRLRIAQRQVETFEAGLLAEAENALRVAEAAYRLGERGILDYLDAQRTFRSVRSDYINARFDRQAAWIDLERLTAAESSQ